MNRIEARVPGLGFNKLKEGSSETLPAMGGFNSDVVNEKFFVVNGEDDRPTIVPWLSATVTRWLAMTGA